ncbi:unnamed protein product [Amoebophrya sp. A120]|nr:unnamed protein product [Amoebophrya sp. A120]|eukprot:GSA120T00022047001.1
MQVDILRKDGQVVFVEGGSDFADFLVGILKAPVGSLVAAVRRSVENNGENSYDTATTTNGNSSAFANLQTSLESNVRAPLFAGGKKGDVLATNALDLTNLADPAASVPAAGKATETLSPLGIVCGGSYLTLEEPSSSSPGEFSCTVNDTSGGGSWQTIVFTETEEFELTMSYDYWQKHYVMLGLYPAVPSLKNFFTGENPLILPGVQRGFFVNSCGGKDLCIQCGGPDNARSVPWNSAKFGTETRIMPGSNPNGSNVVRMRFGWKASEKMKNKSIVTTTSDGISTEDKLNKAPEKKPSKHLEFDFGDSGTWEKIQLYHAEFPTGKVFPAVLFNEECDHKAKITIKPYKTSVVVPSRSKKSSSSGERRSKTNSSRDTSANDTNCTSSSPFFQPLSKFLVANDLTICECGSMRTLELFQKFGVKSVEELQCETVAITEKVLTRLLERALSGNEDVLQYAFAAVAPGKDAAVDVLSGGPEVVQVEDSFEFLAGAAADEVAPPVDGEDEAA